MNHHIRTVVVVPMTTKGRPCPSQVPCRFQGRQGQVVLEQIRTVDKARLARKLGRISKKTGAFVLSVLGEMFAP